MKIKTIDGQEVNTDKMSDLGAEMIEIIEKSPLYDFVQKHNGMCYILAAVPGGKPWSKMHLNDRAKVDYLLLCVNEIVEQVTGGKMMMALIPKQGKTPENL